jgi:hypothetical protein
MAKTFDAIDDRLAAWIAAQPAFFVATAPLSADGLVNVSPKGLAGTFTVVGPRSVAWLDLTGSGVETIAHLRENGRIVVMFCAFDGPPRIVRLHGRGTVAVPGSAEFDELVGRFPPLPGVRSVVSVAVERISDSCGFGVPRMTLEGDRDDLVHWARRKGPAGIVEYQRTRNATSIDGLRGLDY